MKKKFFTFFSYNLPTGTLPSDLKKIFGAQKHADPADPDPVLDPDPQHWI
jgi:hypothetical protein